MQTRLREEILQGGDARGMQLSLGGLEKRGAVDSQGVAGVTRSHGSRKLIRRLNLALREKLGRTDAESAQLAGRKDPRRVTVRGRPT